MPHLLILSKQNALKTYGVSHNLGEANLLAVCIFFRHAFDRSPAIFLPGRWSSNTFEITKGSLGYLSSMYFSTSLVLGEVVGPFPEIES